jgi:hypothetical protein
LGRNVLGAQAPEAAENGRSALEHSRGKADAVAGHYEASRAVVAKTFIGLVAGGS